MDYNFVYLNATTIMSDFTQNSSVARGGAGGLEPSHWPEEYAKYTVLALFRPSFALKTKIASPQRYWR